MRTPRMRTVATTARAVPAALAVLAAVLLVTVGPAGPPAAVGAHADVRAGDRLTERADDFVVRWGRAFNRGDWAAIRRTSGPGVRRHLAELRSLRGSGTRLPLTRNCERPDGMPPHERLCSFGVVLEASPVRTATGVLRMRRVAVYR